jgi:hypothetical protein
MIEVFDKPKVLRSQLDSAVRLVSLEDDVIAAHSIVMACEELFRMWYVKKDLFVDFDYRIFIKDEYHHAYLKTIRADYNFFKHADRDLDAVIDVDHEQFHRRNEVMLFLHIAGYRKVFGEISPVMQAYFHWATIAYPGFIKWENVPGGEDRRSQIAKIEDDSVLKRQLLRVMLYDVGALDSEDFSRLQLWKATTKK